MNRNRLVGWALALLLSAAAALAAPPSDGLTAANALYQRGDFAGARQAYERLLAAERPSVGLLYNLGNACYQLGDMGWAIAYYEQARLAAPRDPDLRANLTAALAARRASGGTAVPGWLQVIANAILDRCTLGELAGLGVLVYLLAVVLAWQWLHKGQLRRRGRWVLNVAVAATLVLGGLTAAKVHRDHNPNRVVLVSDTQLLSGPAAEFSVVRRAYQGEMGVAQQRQGMWCEVELESGTRGWLMQTATASPVPSRAAPAAAP